MVWVTEDILVDLRGLFLQQIYISLKMHINVFVPRCLVEIFSKFSSTGIGMDNVLI